MDFQHQLPTAPSWSSGPSVSIQKVIGSSILNDNAGVSFSDNHLAITAGAGSIVISIDETSLISTSDKFYCSIREDSQTKIKSATCVSLSPVKRLLAVGEIGHSPAILIFSTHPTASTSPLLSLQEHRFGITHLSWSPCGNYLASLGTANDGFLHVWHIKQKDHNTLSADLIASNKCLSTVFDMKWAPLSSSPGISNDLILITAGVRHLRVWRLISSSSPFPVEAKAVLASRNVVLGQHSNSTFTAIQPINRHIVAVITERGEVGRISLNYNSQIMGSSTQPDHLTLQPEFSERDETDTGSSSLSSNGSVDDKRTIGSVTGTFDVLLVLDFKPTSLACEHCNHWEDGCKVKDDTSNRSETEDGLVWITGLLSELRAIPFSVFLVDTCSRTPSPGKRPSPSPPLLFPSTFPASVYESYCAAASYNDSDTLGKNIGTGYVVGMIVLNKGHHDRYVIRYTNSNDLVVTHFKQNDTTCENDGWKVLEKVIRLGNEEGIKGSRRVFNGNNVLAESSSNVPNVLRSNIVDKYTGEFITWSVSGLIRIWATDKSHLETMRSQDQPTEQSSLKIHPETVCIGELKINVHDTIDITMTPEPVRFEWPNHLTEAICIDYFHDDTLDSENRNDKFLKLNSRKTVAIGDRHGIIRLVEYTHSASSSNSVEKRCKGTVNVMQYFKAHGSEVVGIDYGKHLNEESNTIKHGRTRGRVHFEVLVSYGRDKIVQIFCKQNALPSQCYKPVKTLDPRQLQEQDAKTTEWKLLQTLTGHKSNVIKAIVLNNCERVIICSSDRTVTIHKAIFDETVYEMCLEDGTLKRFKHRELVGYIPEKIISLKATPCDLSVVEVESDYSVPSPSKDHRSAKRLVTTIGSDKQQTSSMLHQGKRTSELVIACNDKQIHVYKFPTGEHIRSYKTVDERGDGIVLKEIVVVEVSVPIIYSSTKLFDSLKLDKSSDNKQASSFLSTLPESALLPSYYLIGMAADKSLRVYDHNDKLNSPLLCTEWGHAEGIVGLDIIGYFHSLDSKAYGQNKQQDSKSQSLSLPVTPELSITLISCGNDGCVFLWSLAGFDTFHIQNHTSSSISSILLANATHHQASGTGGSFQDFGSGSLGRKRLGITRSVTTHGSFLEGNNYRVQPSEIPSTSFPNNSGIDVSLGSHLPTQTISSVAPFGLSVHAPVRRVFSKAEMNRLIQRGAINNGESEDSPTSHSLPDSSISPKKASLSKNSRRRTLATDTASTGLPYSYSMNFTTGKSLRKSVSRKSLGGSLMSSSASSSTSSLVSSSENEFPFINRGISRNSPSITNSPSLNSFSEMSISSVSRPKVTRTISSSSLSSSSSIDRHTLPTSLRKKLSLDALASSSQKHFSSGLKPRISATPTGGGPLKRSESLINFKTVGSSELDELDELEESLDEDSILGKDDEIGSYSLSKDDVLNTPSKPNSEVSPRIPNTKSYKNTSISLFESKRQLPSLQSTFQHTPHIPVVTSPPSQLHTLKAGVTPRFSNIPNGEKPGTSSTSSVLNPASTLSPKGERILRSPRTPGSTSRRKVSGSHRRSLSTYSISPSSSLTSTTTVTPKGSGSSPINTSNGVTPTKIKTPSPISHKSHPQTASSSLPLASPKTTVENHVLLPVNAFTRQSSASLSFSCQTLAEQLRDFRAQFSTDIFSNSGADGSNSDNKYVQELAEELSETLKLLNQTPNSVTPSNTALSFPQCSQLSEVSTAFRESSALDSTKTSPAQSNLTSGNNDHNRSAQPQHITPLSGSPNVLNDTQVDQIIERLGDKLVDLVASKLESEFILRKRIGN